MAWAKHHPIVGKRTEKVPCLKLNRVRYCTARLHYPSDDQVKPGALPTNYSISEAIP